MFWGETGRERKRARVCLLTEKLSQRETSYGIFVFTGGIHRALRINSVPTEDAAVNLSFATQPDRNCPGRFGGKAAKERKQNPLKERFIKGSWRNELKYKITQKEWNSKEVKGESLITPHPHPQCLILPCWAWGRAQKFSFHWSELGSLENAPPPPATPCQRY